MLLSDRPKHIYEPTPLQCGQAVLAMLTGKQVSEIVEVLGNDRETTLKEMKKGLQLYGIVYSEMRREAERVSDLPDICILSLETPHCWHWSLYFKGLFYDPEYGILKDFPPSTRRYFWEIHG